MIEVNDRNFNRKELCCQGKAILHPCVFAGRDLNSYDAKQRHAVSEAQLMYMYRRTSSLAFLHATIHPKDSQILIQIPTAIASTPIGYAQRPYAAVRLQCEHHTAPPPLR